jgi:hypothetical protein
LREFFTVFIFIIPTPPQHTNQHPSLFYNYEDICNDLNIITQKNKIGNLQIQGGEFFLHPDAFKIISYVVSNKSVISITIATNGTIIPPDDILNVIASKKKCYIRISRYPIVAAKTRKDLEEKLNKFGIRFFIYDFAGDESLWEEFNGIDAKKLDHETVINLYNTCPFRNCTTLENGFIAKCSRATVAHFVQKFKITADDGINIRNNYNAEKLFLFIHNGKPMTACHYCRKVNLKKILPAQQMTAEEIKDLRSIIHAK